MKSHDADLKKLGPGQVNIYGASTKFIVRCSFLPGPDRVDDYAALNADLKKLVPGPVNVYSASGIYQ